jgi:hypothetical protein
MDTDAFILWLCNPAAASETDAFILWLHGPAGAGKTAIARRVAELCEAQGLLLASFLFFRSDPKRNTMKPLVANITYSVARVIPITNELIKIAIEADPLILTYSIEVQLTKLVLEPLRFLADQGHFLSGNFPRLVVIDGLDECLDKDGQTNLIQFLASAVVRNQLPLKFLIVSRPEAHIKLAVALASQRTTFSHLELNDDFLPDEDIRRFLTDKLHEIKTCHPFRLGIPSFWPSKQQMDELIRKASGQFIYASLVVRFVKSACDSPMRQLDIVLGLRPPIDHDLPFAELDTLYRFILSRAKQLDLVLLILGVRYTLERHCSVWRLTTMENVLGLEDGDISIYLSPLNSLLKIDPRRHPPITFHHSSFSDFLCNPERSGTDYCIELPKCDSLIAQCMLKMFPRNSKFSVFSYLIVLNETSIGSPPRFDPWLCFTELLYYIKKSSWTFELERAIESFSLTDYLGWLDSSSCARFDDDNVQVWYAEFPEKLLNYLKGKVSNPCTLKPILMFSFSFLTRENLTFMNSILGVT